MRPFPVLSVPESEMKVMPGLEAAEYFGSGYGASIRDALVVGFLHSR